MTIRPRPANDGIADAQVLDTGRPTQATGTTVDATSEPGEPVVGADTRSGTVWYRFTPAESGAFTVDTCDSGFDTLLGVFTGTAVNRLTAVATNDDACGAQSRVRINATAGQTYWVRVSGVDGAGGPVRLFVRPERRAR